MSQKINSFISALEERIAPHTIVAVERAKYGHSGVGVHILEIDTGEKLVLRIFWPDANSLLSNPQDMHAHQTRLAHLGLPVPRQRHRFSVSGIEALTEDFVFGEHQLHPQPQHAISVAKMLAHMHLSTAAQVKGSDDNYTSRWRINFSRINHLLKDAQGRFRLANADVFSKALIYASRNEAFDGLELDKKVRRFASSIYSEGLCEELDAYITKFSRLIQGEKDLYTCSVHGDVTTKNVFFASGTTEIVGLIDFGSLRKTYALHDLSHAITAWSYAMDDKNRLNTDWIRQMVRAMFTSYNDIRPLSAGERNLMPLFIVARFVEYAVDFTWLFLSGLRGTPHPRMLFLDPIEVIQVLRSFSKDILDPNFVTMFNLAGDEK